MYRVLILPGNRGLFLKLRFNQIEERLVASGAKGGQLCAGEQMITVRTLVPGVNAGPPGGPEVGIVQLADTGFSRLCIVPEVEESALDVQITGLDRRFSLSFDWRCALGRKIQMDLLHALVDDLSGIAPKICAAVRVSDILYNVTFKEQCAAAAIIVKLIDGGTALRADQILVCQENLPQRQSTLRVGMGTLRVGTGINALDPLKQHVHPGRKQHGVFLISGQGNHCQQYADSCQCLLFCGLRENVSRQLQQGDSRSTALADHLIKWTVGNQMSVHPSICRLCLGKWCRCVWNTGPEAIQRCQTPLLRLLKLCRCAGEEPINGNVVFHLPLDLLQRSGKEPKAVRRVRRSQLLGKALDKSPVLFTAIRHTGCCQNKLDSLAGNTQLIEEAANQKGHFPTGRTLVHMGLINDE